MYGLVLFVGELVERMGRRAAMTGGLLTMAASNLSLVWLDSVAGMSVSMFGLGLGWCFAYVGATELVDRAALVERGRLIGFTDLLSGFTGATLALVGGVVYTQLGVAAVAVFSTVAVVLPALVIGLAARRPPPREALEPAG
jgi:MFS family permease